MNLRKIFDSNQFPFDIDSMRKLGLFIRNTYGDSSRGSQYKFLEDYLKPWYERNGLKLPSGETLDSYIRHEQNLLLRTPALLTDILPQGFLKDFLSGKFPFDSNAI